MPYQSTADLIADALWRAGEPTDGTSDYATKVLDYLNRAYQALWYGGQELDPSIHEEWWWLRKYPPANLNLQGSRSDGSVSVTNDSTAVITSFPVVTQTLWPPWFFTVQGHPDVYRVVGSIAPNTITLGSAYTGTTATDAAYRLMVLEYGLAPDVLRVISPMRVFRGGSWGMIDGMDLTALEWQYPLAAVPSGPPAAFAMVSESVVRFSHSGNLTPQEAIRVEYDYLERPPLLSSPGGGEEPVVPREWRKVLADFALMFLLIDKNDDRASDAGNMAKAGLAAMARENHHKQRSIGRDFGRIDPRNPYPSRRWPLKTESGLIVAW